MTTRRQRLIADLDALNQRVTNNETIKAALVKRYSLDDQMSLGDILHFMRRKANELEATERELSEWEKEDTP